MKPLGILLITALVTPANAWDDYRDSNNSRQMPEYRHTNFIRPARHTVVVTPPKIEIPEFIPAAPIKKDESYMATAINAIKAPFEGIGVFVKAILNLPIIKPVQEGLRVVIGFTIGILTGDTFKKSNPVQFDNNGPAVITINGVRNNEDQARQINNFAKKVVGVEVATQIKNESFLFGIGDLIQSIKYEYLGALDKPVMDTYKAIQQGIHERGFAIVFAHSQGTAVYRQAESLLTEAERDLVKFVGFGNEWNSTAKNAVNIHNPQDPIPWINRIKIITNMILPWNQGRDTAKVTIGGGKGHKFEQYQSSISRAIEEERRERPWEKYLRP